MPVGNENNENIKGSAENTQGGKSAAPKKKLNVVFRKQNSTSIKELPKRLKNAADGGEPKVKEDVQAAVKKPRPLPAGTKPVKPAAGLAAKPAAPAAEKKAEAMPKEEVKEVKKPAAEPVEKTEPAVKNEAHTEAAAPSAKAEASAKTEEPKAAEAKEQAEPVKKPSLTDPIVPKVKIVKSYANYDAAAVIAEASRKARTENGQRNAARNGGDGQRRPRPNDGQRRFDGNNQGQRGQNGQNQDAQKGGGRGFAGRGNAAPGQRGPRPAGGQQGGGRSGGGAQFEAPQSKNQNGRGRNSYSGKDKKDRRDKYVDDLSAANKPKSGKGAFIKPEPKAEKPEDEIKVITIPETLTIKELADKLRLQPSVIVKKLFLAGKMVTPNTDLSYEEAEEIAMEYDILCEKEVEVDVIAELLKEDEEDESKLVTRNPVVCVMGHVDHGTTS